MLRNAGSNVAAQDGACETKGQLNGMQSDIRVHKGHDRGCRALLPLTRWCISDVHVHHEYKTSGIPAMPEATTSTMAPMRTPFTETLLISQPSQVALAIATKPQSRDSTHLPIERNQEAARSQSNLTEGSL